MKDTTTLLFLLFGLISMTAFPQDDGHARKFSFGMIAG
jgi:hypothetical protein